MSLTILDMKAFQAYAACTLLLLVFQFSS